MKSCGVCDGNHRQRDCPTVAMAVKVVEIILPEKVKEDGTLIDCLTCGGPYLKNDGCIWCRYNQ
jgi:hypothetical protein